MTEIEVQIASGFMGIIAGCALIYGVLAVKDWWRDRK